LFLSISTKETIHPGTDNIIPAFKIIFGDSPNKDICVSLVHAPIKTIRNPIAVMGKIIFLGISKGFIQYVLRQKNLIRR
jgi:hypothetical protein